MTRVRRRSPRPGTEKGQYGYKRDSVSQAETGEGAPGQRDITVKAEPYSRAVKRPPPPRV